MTFDYYHFENNQMPHAVIQSIKILEDFNTLLKEILIEEIKQGNKIFEVSTGWPKPESILVQMRYSFKKKYEKKDIERTELSDKHYYKEEYSSKAPLHLLICPF